MHSTRQNNTPRVKVAAKADVNILPVVTLGLILSLVVVLLDIGAVSGT